MNEEKIIIFDFDGVIADSFDIVLEVKRIAIPSLTEESYRMKFNGNIVDAKYKEKVVEEIDFFTEYGRRFKFLDIDKNVKDVIKNLSKDFKLFIVSSTINPIIEEYLVRHGILDCFTDIISHDIETSKVKRFQMIFKKYKISPNKTIFISDTSGDINEAQEAKINFIVGILGGYQDKESLEKAEPDIIVKDFNDFSRVVQERNKQLSCHGNKLPHTVSSFFLPKKRLLTS